MSSSTNKPALPNFAGMIPLAPRRQTLREAVESIRARKDKIRQEHLSGIHNPWNHSAELTDPWAFLDACENKIVRDAAAAVLGPDLLLWDSELFLQAREYGAFVGAGREGRYWPAVPLNGAVVLLDPTANTLSPAVYDISLVREEILLQFDPSEPLFVIRIMAASSHFERNLRHPANWVAMEEQVLINYTTRPLWLLGGKNSGRSDLVTGFSPAVPAWAAGVPEALEEGANAVRHS